MSEDSLLKAAEGGDRDMVEKLLKEGKDVNVRDEKGRTCLHLAMVSPRPKQISLIELLLEAGADPFATDGNGETPLLWASRFGKTKIAEKLVMLGADVHTKDGVRGWSILLHAAFHGHGEIADLLLAKGADSTVVGGDGTTVLHAACAGGLCDLAARLIDHGAKVNVQDDQGQSPLVLAVENEHFSLVGMLLEKDADPNIVYRHDTTLLHYCAMNALDGPLRMLIDAGAGVNGVDGDGNTPLDLTEEDEEDFDQVIGLLKAAGALRSDELNTYR